MIDAQIADGDWVIIQKCQTARHGDIVVAQTEDGEATLKQWYPERNRIRLQPANDSMKPIYVDSTKFLEYLLELSGKHKPSDAGISRSRFIRPPQGSALRSRFGLVCCTEFLN